MQKRLCEKNRHIGTKSMVGGGQVDYVTAFGREGRGIESSHRRPTPPPSSPLSAAATLREKMVHIIISLMKEVKRCKDKKLFIH